MELLRVDPPGCDLSVVRRPPAARPSKGALVFLHGLGGASSDFAQALESEALAPFGVVLLDLLGHGTSDKPANFDYRPASHAAVLFQALGKLRPAAPVVLVGYSLGAAVALELSRLPLAGLSGVVLVEPAVEEARMPFAAKVAAIPEGEFRARYGEFLEPYASPVSTDADRHWAETAAFASSSAFHRSAKGLLEAARRGELTAHLREARVPLALILSPATHSEWALEAKLERDGAPLFLVESPSRAPMLENPSPFYLAVRAAAEATLTRPRGKAAERGP